MSMMSHREDNMVRWVGVRPAHRGTQINKYGWAIDGTTIIHTVTAAKIFYLVTLFVRGNASAVPTYVYCEVRDADDVSQYELASIYLDAVGQDNAVLPYNPPLEIPAGWDIVVVSGAATSDVWCSVFGWEEPIIVGG